MKLKMLRNIMVNGKIAIAGMEIEVTDRDGFALIRRGAADPVGDVEPQTVQEDGFLDEPDETETPEDEPQQPAEPAPKPKSKGK
jgi:hypothetical protein